MKTLSRLILFTVLFASTAELVSAAAVSGVITDADTGKPLASVSVQIPGTEIGTFSRVDGSFTLRAQSLPDSLQFSHIAYRTLFIIPRSENIGSAVMRKRVLEQDEIIVSANRSRSSLQPASVSVISAEEIKASYTVEDVPMILSSESGMHAYSESGSGSGYSYVTLRGFDQSRIAVMLDNVSLNDNESHQVYWVDHADILSDATDVQIQKGVGSSLYGASAFGGAINVQTAIASDERRLTVSSGLGSYNTEKYRAAWQSGPLAGSSLYLSARLSAIRSDGYRDKHGSEQLAGFFGLEYNRGRMQNRFRALIGNERTHLVWWGVDAAAIDDREARREAYDAYIDDFHQQIYSLNTRYLFSDRILFTNTAYLVRGSGYYENEEPEADYYSYALDLEDSLTDSAEQMTTTSLTRRKWIQNRYFGSIPVLTLKQNNYRLDLGGEFRFYTGDHFGEVNDLGNEYLSNSLSDWSHRYYAYNSLKYSNSLFMRLNVALSPELRSIADLQLQSHVWNLEQETIGHAFGYSLKNDWLFLNPKVGLQYQLTRDLSLQSFYGQGRKEPADNRMIDADDVFGEPRHAAAEKVSNLEFGLSLRKKHLSFNLTGYFMSLTNQQIKELDINRSGEYLYSTAEATRHRGTEWELNWLPGPYLNISLNHTLNRIRYSSGEFDGNFLPNIPLSMANLSLRWRFTERFRLNWSSRYTDIMYVQAANTAQVPSSLIHSAGLAADLGIFSVSARVNNLFNTLYSTYSADWDGWLYYWPAADRNLYLGLELSL